MKHKLWILLICLFPLLTLSMEATYKLTIQNDTEFNFKATDLGLAVGDDAGGAFFSKKPSNNPSEFNSIPHNTSKDVTWDYYYPTTIKLTVLFPSYMIGATNKDKNNKETVLELTTQTFKLDDGMNSGAEFKLTVTQDNQDKLLSISKIRDYKYGAEKIKEKEEEKIQKILNLEKTGAKTINITNQSDYTITLQFSDTYFTIKPHDQRTYTSTNNLRYAASGTPLIVLINNTGINYDNHTQIKYNEPVKYAWSSWPDAVYLQFSVSASKDDTVNVNIPSFKFQTHTYPSSVNKGRSSDRDAR